jgi:hypothetical protein
MMAGVVVDGEGAGVRPFSTRIVTKDEKVGGGRNFKPRACD